MSASSLILGIILAFVESWRMALVQIALLPLMILVGYFENEMMTDTGKVEAGLGGAIVHENVTNIRTVRAMNIMDNTLKRFYKKIEESGVSIKKMIWKSLLASTGTSMVFLILACQFYVGAVFMRDYGLEFVKMMRALFCLFFASYAIGMGTQLIGDVS